MNLEQVRTVLRRYWRSITAVTLAVLLATAIATALTPKRYTATASLFMNVRGAASASDLNQGGSYMERQVSSYASVANSALVLDPVIAKLGLHTTAAELAKSTSVVSPANTTLLRISATAPSAEQSQQLANAIAEQLVASVPQLSPAANANAQSLVTVTVTDPALLPVAPSSPKIMQNAALGLVLALLLGIGQAILRAGLDTKVRTVRDVAASVEPAVIGTVARAGSKKAGYGYSSSKYAVDAVGEDLRRLRTNLRFLGLGTNRMPYLVVTSAEVQEGKTYTAVGLARVLAGSGAKILLVDADLRRPMVATRLELENQVGLSHVLSGQVEASDVIERHAKYGFDVIPSGAVPPNPAELLAGPQLMPMLEGLRERYDLILIDTAPVLPVTDGVVLAAQVGAAVVVARAGKVTRPKLAAAVDAIEAGGGDVLGVILNGVDGEDAAPGYGYGYAPREREREAGDVRDAKEAVA